MKNIFVTLFICTIATQFMVAQNLKRANHAFEKRAYLNAAELFLKEENKTQEILEKLGDSYYFNTKMKEATTWYGKLLQKYEHQVKSTYYFRYSQALKGIKNFSEADKWFQKYQEKLTLSSSTKLETKPFFDTLNKQIKRPYTLHKVSKNSSGSDFGLSFYGTNVVFASTRNSGELYDWNKQPYLDLFQANVNASGDLENVTPFSNTINTKMHESNAVFTKDGKTMYFTRNNFIAGKKRRDKNKITHLKIYKAFFINNEWTNITELPFNSDNYSVEHPALSPDEKQLYFASDMPGTIGSFDLFVVSINSDGTYGSPKNLGPKINTQHREQFPFISVNNTLYFASNGHFGMGGLDIFKSELNNNTFSNPINLSDVVNSNLDDFAFVLNDAMEGGYFSSNRNGGKGDDDIYRITQMKKNFISGVVQDKNTLELLPETIVTLYDANNTVIAEKIVAEDAAYSFEIFRNNNYKIKGVKKLYVPSEIEFSTDAEGNKNKDILLNLESYEDAEKNIAVESGRTQIKINPIYFDFDKWNIRPDAAKELNEVVNILKKYPDMLIEVGAHTDSRGSDIYNQLLSEKRAKSVRDYLISNGVDSNNVKSVGYGESKPLNNCHKEKNCTEKDYDTNRRCEFVILN